MSSSVILSAATLGLFGSLHCIFMCGPLVIGACTSHGGGRSGGLSRYLLGRLISYTFAGAMLGHLGALGRGRLHLEAVQNGLILFIASVALARGLTLLLGARPTSEGAVRTSRPAAWVAVVTSLVSRQPLGLGLASGAFPCGLMAGAWALAATSAHPVTGAAVMAAFAVATAPALLVSVFAAQSLIRLRSSPVASGLAWCLVAAVLAARPLLAVAGRGCH